ncbi:MAG: V-type ATP synthase subunit I [Sphaerochaetaceae bacterium]|jgi:V/A-type H+-transporting ATPase subunit I
MIVKMKKVSVIVQAHDKKDMLRELRKAGLLHISDAAVRTATVEELQKEGEAIARIRSQIQESAAAWAKRTGRKGRIEQLSCTDAEFDRLHSRLSDMLVERKELSEAVAKESLLREQIKDWGDFDPESVQSLVDAGVRLTFYTIGKKELERIPQEISYVRLAPVGKMVAIAVPGDLLPAEISATRFELPEYGLSELDLRINNARKRLSDIEDEFASCARYVDAYSLRLSRTEQSTRFEEVASAMGDGDQISWVSGFIPEPKADEFRRLAADNGWGYLIDDPSEDDNPPTLIKYPKGVGIIKPVFDILGTVPGYRENDISMWFLLFFTLFFAMIIGDAGYGVVFLAVAIGLHVKQRKATNLTVLLYVLSIATVVWGALTGTWFGSEVILESAPFLQKLVIPEISNYPQLFGVDTVSAQNAVMKFCFIIGTVQLSLACVLNVIHKIPKRDLSAFADVGWMIDILALYFMVLQLVVGAHTNISMIFGAVGVGFLLVCVFGSQGPGVSFLQGLKSGLGGFFTTFLNTISCFSNIMSYIRLFAVGMASLAIAQSFNNMASGMLHGFALPAGILVLAIGHGLNLVMGLLSVVVHGVRLNLLEFSGQLGMEWTGVSYDPFRETVQES